jgi:hypothetical protein
MAKNVGDEGQVGEHQRLVNELHLGARNRDKHRREYDGACRSEGRAPGNGEEKGKHKGKHRRAQEDGGRAAGKERCPRAGQELDAGAARLRNGQGDQKSFHRTLIGTVAKYS